jgi:hypothetical protein
VKCGKVMDVGLVGFLESAINHQGEKQMRIKAARAMSVSKRLRRFEIQLSVSMWANQSDKGR